MGVLTFEHFGIKLLNEQQSNTFNHQCYYWHLLRGLLADSRFVSTLCVIIEIQIRCRLWSTLTPLAAVGPKINSQTKTRGFWKGFARRSRISSPLKMLLLRVCLMRQCVARTWGREMRCRCRLGRAWSVFYYTLTWTSLAAEPFGRCRTGSHKLCPTPSLVCVQSNRWLLASLSSDLLNLVCNIKT